jgi:hypothetical protein
MALLTTSTALAGAHRWTASSAADGEPATEKSKFAGSLFKLDYGDNFTKGDPLWVELTLDT